MYMFSMALCLLQNQLRKKPLEPETIMLFRISKCPCFDDDTIAPEKDTLENFSIDEDTGTRA